jgi:hypothetical protein
VGRLRCRGRRIVWFGGNLGGGFRVGGIKP